MAQIELELLEQIQSICSKLKSLRKEQNWSQEKAGAMIGYSSGYIAQMERIKLKRNGYLNFSRNSWIRYAALFGLSENIPVWNTPSQREDASGLNQPILFSFRGQQGTFDLEQCGYNRRKKPGPKKKSISTKSSADTLNTGEGKMGAILDNTEQKELIEQLRTKISALEATVKEQKKELKIFRTKATKEKNAAEKESEAEPINNTVAPALTPIKRVALQGKLLLEAVQEVKQDLCIPTSATDSGHDDKKQILARRLEQYCDNIRPLIDIAASAGQKPPATAKKKPVPPKPVEDKYLKPHIEI